MLSRRLSLLSWAAIVVLAAECVVLLFWASVIPMLERTFSDFGAALPAPAQYTYVLFERPIGAVVLVALAMIGISVSNRGARDFTLIALAGIGAILTGIATSSLSGPLLTVIRTSP